MNEAKLKRLETVCCGNRVAMDFLLRWVDYIHRIDDVEDGVLVHSDDRLAIQNCALELFTHPFFLQYKDQIKPVVLLANNDFADAVLWEKSAVQWQREEADVIRHAGGQVTRLVAYLCAEQVAPGTGFAHLRQLSLGMRETAWHEHHDSEGKPC